MCFGQKDKNDSNDLSIREIKMITKILITIVIILSFSIPSIASIQPDENTGRLLPILNSDILQKFEDIDRLLEELKKRLQHILPTKSFPLYDEEDL